jgi:L-iditol 2-dehydrogenase
MKVLRLRGIHDFILTDEPTPIPGGGEVLLKTAVVSICGSDTHWYSEGQIGGVSLMKPLVLGHEFSAVLASGQDTGARVAVDPAIPCMHCEFCLEGKPNVCPDIRFAGANDIDGALREYLPWPEENIYLLPDSISNIEGAMLEPLGVGLHALELGPIGPGETVGVYGTGTIGLMIIALARLAGAARIFATDLLPGRLETALKMGATDVFLADGSEGKKVWDATGRRGVDVAFESAGENDAVETAMVTSKPGGRAVIVGITADNKTTFTASVARKKGLTIMISRRMKRTYPRAITLVSSRRLDLSPLISHILPFSRYEEGFQLAEKRSGVKVVLEF